VQYPPKQDKIIGVKEGMPSETWLTWFKQVTDGSNFIAPAFSGGHSASIDFTSTAGKLSPWPGFLVLSFSTVASALTITLPVAPINSLLIVARPATGGSNLVIDGTYTLTSQTWIALMADGNIWNKIAGGSL
jgi:hypothetical protein